MDETLKFRFLIMFIVATAFSAGCSSSSKRMQNPNQYNRLIHDPVEKTYQGVVRSNNFESNEKNPNDNAYSARYP